MTNEQRMTASMHARLDEIRRRKGLGRWPVTPDMVSKRKAQEDKAKEAERARLKAQEIAREREKEMAKKEGRKPRRNVLTKPISTDLIGGRIREARMNLGMGTREFADRHGFQLAEVSQWERGTRPPKPEKLARLAKALEVSVTWLKEGRR